MNATSWDFQSASTTASGIIPTLILALVLEKQLLLAAARYSEEMRRQISDLPRWANRILDAVPAIPFVPMSSLMKTLLPALTAPKGLITIAVIAEMVALTGVAIPANWIQGVPGQVAASIGLVFVGWAVLMLLLQVASGLVVVAEGVQPRADDERNPPE